MKRRSPIVLFCDDVRQEVSGKFILVGVYGTDALVESFPVNLALRPFVTLDVPKGVAELDVHVKLTSGATIANGKFEIENFDPSKDQTFLVLPMTAINLSSEDEIEVLVRLDGAKWVGAGSLRVKQRPA